MEEEKTYSVGLRVSWEMKEALKIESQKRHLQISDIVREYIRRGLRRKDMK